MVISKIATSKNHIELLYSTHDWAPVKSETGFVILGKFWCRSDLRHHRNQKFLCGHQGHLSKRTVSSTIGYNKFSTTIDLQLYYRTG
jgi:hypothetical protein